MKREKIKTLIELSQNVEEADSVIENAGYTNVREKIAFLDGMFDFTLVGRHVDDTVSQDEAYKMDYYAILSAIINTKWEA